MKSNASQRARLQFSLRFILLVITALAIVLAVSAPYVRTWEITHQLQLAKATGAIGLGALLMLGIMGVMRYRADSKGGKLLLSVGTAGSRKIQWTSILMIGGALLIIGLGIFSLILLNHSVVYSQLFVGGVSLTQGLLFYHWKVNVSIDFSTNGVISVGWRFIPWERLKVLHWNPANGILELNVPHFMKPFVVPPSQRDQVDAILAQAQEQCGTQSSIGWDEISAK